MNNNSDIKSPPSVINRKIKNPILWILISLAIVSIDQLTKYLAVVFLQPLGSTPLIKNILDLTYVTNRGAAFGILSDHRWVYITISFIAILAMIYILLFYTQRTLLLEIGIALMLGGGIGNMIDRLRLGYVVDLLEFPFINFAIFNIADSCICVGAALMCIYMIKHEFIKPKDSTPAQAPARTDENEG
ncbi:MAG: signal peptidase II [Eubacteriales bacterium]